MKATKNWVLMVLLLLLVPAINAYAAPLPDTGQTKCYDNSAEMIACPVPGEAFYGQDGNYNINPPSYTKLDASGNALSDDATSWAMIKDNVTGLIWENKTNDGSIHDGSKIFTWCDRDSATNGLNQGICGTGTGTDNGATDTEAFIKALNDTHFGGFSDWRLPTPKELTTIVDRNLINPAVNATWFPNTALIASWSSASDAHSGTSAWCIYFSEGIVNNGNCQKTYGYSSAIRAVRGEEGRGKNIDNGDGTVTDTKTGLMWQQETVNGKTWQGALDYAKTLALAGYDDWRIPNTDELQSIVDYSHYNPSIDTATFPGTVQSGYWSSTTYTGGGGDVWAVWFNYGYVSNYGSGNSKANAYAVRAVRGGQNRTLGSLVISAPTQAERWDIGAQKAITWDTASIAENVKISLSLQGGKTGTFTEVIAENTLNTGSYNWTVTGPSSVNCALRIEPVSDSSKVATQSLFTITNLLSAGITAEKLGDTGHYKLALTGRYSDGPSPLAATFTTSDVSIATVDQYGYLTALKNGYVEVSAIYNGDTYKKGIFVYSTLDDGETLSNNTKDLATVMAASTTDPTAGRFYKGTLTTGDTDWFKFTLAQGAIVNVGYLSQSATADVQMDLYSAADTLMASAISTSGAPLILPVGLPAGDYYLKLTPTGDIDQTGSYIVTYKTLGSLPTKTTIPIAFSETKTATIDTLADKQDLTFTLAAEQAIRMLFAPSSPTAKYRLTLLNGSQTVIDRLDCLDQKPVSFQAIYGSGGYTLQVTPLGVVDVQNPFTVLLATSDGQLEKEPNNAAAQATLFDITRPMTGRLSTDTDLDFYTFQLDAPRFLEMGFTATGSTGNFALTLFKESDQYEIDGIDISGGAMTALHIGLGAGRYYLRVKGGMTNSDTINNYTLTFQDSPQTDLEIESNNTLKVANAIDKSQAKRGRIYSTQDKDYFGFNLPEGGFISLTFTPTTTTGGYKVSLVDENYEKTATALDTYTSQNGTTISMMDLNINVPGNYYILVESDGAIDQYKPYALNLTGTVPIVGLKQLVNVAVTGIKETMIVSDTQTLAAKAGYSDATIAAVTPAWASLNPSVATVNAAGLVTALAQGTTSIVASYGGITGKFDLTVGAPQIVVKQHYGNLILVGGGGYLQTNTLKESTMYLTDLVYRRFKERLFAADDIYYLHPWPAHDLDGDGFPENIIRDTVPTVAKLGDAITKWAASQSTDGPLYVYLVDHGGLDYFVIYEDANHVQENLTATQLKGFIDAFQTATNRQVIVVIEACKSGSFVNDLETEGRNRIVLTSTNDQYQFLSGAGTDTFTQFFMDKLWEGDSLYTAFEKARQKLSNLGKPYNQQVPRLYEGVSLAANNVKIGGDFAVAGAIPSFIEQSPSMPITANSSQEFFARFDPAILGDIGRVWAVVVPPVYTTPGSQILQFPKVDLTDSDRDGKYTGSYSAFTYNGEYRTTFYAETTNGNIIVSAPAVFTVTGGQNPGTPGDINDDTQVTLADAILALQITAGITPDATISAFADVNRDGKIGLVEAIYILQKVAGMR